MGAMLTSYNVVNNSYSQVTDKAKISNQGKTTAELIAEGCRIVGIESQGLDVYSQSRLLLDNMNDNDVKLIKEELANNQSVNTLT